MPASLVSCLSILSTIFFCATLHLPIAARVLPISNSSVENLNLSALPELPDKHFRYVAVYRPPALSEVPAIMACVAALQELAMLDFDTTVSSDKRWTHPNYPGVFLSVYGQPSTPLTVRWAIFLIHAGIRDMMLRERYETGIFFGWYRDVRLGRVLFWSSRQPQPPNPQRPENAPMLSTGTNHTELTFQRGRPGIGSKLVSADQLQANVEYLEKTMDRRDSMLMIIYLMMSLGGRDNEPLVAFQCIFPAITVEVRTIWNALPAAPQGINSGDMINMLAELAVVILRERKYTEMNVVISDEGVEIARGAIRTRPIPKPNSSPLTSDVSRS
ncbi:MAG: hypothetical protein Q9188_007418 [Gyalolechia gomerana]